MTEELAVTQETKDGVEIISFTGEITGSSYAQVTQGVKGLLDEGKKRVLFNLEQVEYISSVGIGALVQADDHFKKAGGKLAVVITNSQVMKTFKITKLDIVLNLFDDLDSALLSLA